jgi:hypothetical protein
MCFNFCVLWMKKMVQCLTILATEENMETEFNDLTTDNLKTDFSNSPDNLTTSDELSASENYVNKMGTAYSISKGVSRAATITGITLTLSAGGYLLGNSMISTPPTVSDSSIIWNEEGSIHYLFTITNDKNYETTFTLLHQDETIFALDVTTPGKYEGDTPVLTYREEVTYQISYHPTQDYIGVLLKGTL